MRLITIMSCLALALACAACGQKQHSDAQQAAPTNSADAGLMVLRIGNGAEPDSLDPQKAQGGWEANIIGTMFLGLMTDGQDGRPVAGAATSWQTSPDGLTWTFKLRPGLNWSDGVPVTADDFVYSLERILDPNTGAEYASLLYGLKNAEPVNQGKMPPTALGVSAPDKETLVIKLEHPVPYLLELARHQTMYAIPKHAVEKYGKDWIKPENIVVDGPYKLTEWVPNAHIKLVKNQDYYDAANVKIDVLYYYPISDRTSELSRYKTGALDFTSSLPVSQYKKLVEDFGSQVHENSYMVNSYSQINVSRPPFNDVRVRRALSLAVDRKIICGQLLRGLVAPAYSLVPPGVANYPNGPQLDFKDTPMSERIAEAKSLLKAAGFGEAHPLKFTYRYFDSDTNRNVAVALQSMWKAIGAQVQILNSEAKVQYDAMRSGDFDVAAAGWIADYNDAQNFLYLFESSTGPMNYGQYNNPEFDALMKKANATVDLAARAKLLEAAEAILLKDGAIIPENYGHYHRLVKPYVKGWTDNFLNLHRPRYMWIDHAATAGG